MFKGEGPDLWKEGLSKPSPEPKGRKRAREPAPALSAQDKVDRLDKDEFVDQIRALVDEGALSKAVRHMLSNGIHDTDSPEVLQALRDLHPTAPPP